MLDLGCGDGTTALPAAQLGAEVLGVDGVVRGDDLVAVVTLPLGLIAAHFDGLCATPQCVGLNEAWLPAPRVSSKINHCQFPLFEHKLTANRNAQETSVNNELPPPAQMFHIITGYWASQAVGTAAKFGISDQLAEGPRSSKEISDAVGANPVALFRLMRMLASIGVFTMDQQERFALTPLGETLRSNVPGSLRNFAVAETATGHWLPWGKMYEAVTTGKPMCQSALGMELWEWYAKHSEEGEYFNGAMGDLSAAASHEVTRVYDFARFRKVVDVGGAHGILLSAILKVNPEMQGVLFDLPHVTATAGSTLEQQGISQRCQVISGDFFKSVPTGGDLHVLKQVIHDWSDAECATLLRNCRQALQSDGKLLLVEMVIPSDNSPSVAQAMDLNMMVLLTGKERTESQYAKLLEMAGFKLDKIIPTNTPFSVIEASCV